MSNKLLRPLLFLLIFLIILQFISKGKVTENTGDDIVISGKTKIAVGKEVTIQIKNNSDFPLIVPGKCPLNPLLVEKYTNGEWIKKESKIDEEKCKNNPPLQIAQKEKYLFGFGQWSWKLFNEEGRYRITLNTKLDGKEKAYSYELAVTQPSFMGHLWQEALYRPILNTLIFLITVIPGNNLGWGILLLTLIIKLLLLGPNQKALKAQKAMQKVQPQLEALKIKYKNDPQRLAQETMQVWKKYKVSPMSSCLPMLIQFPILIALFYVVKGGLHGINPDTLYSTLQDVNLAAINTRFLFLDLTKINYIVVPIVVGGLQFYQMRLTLAKAKTNKPAKKEDAADPMTMMNKMMQYFMPVMIAFFTASLPAAVGFYWGTSTLFGIGQQFFVNKSKD